MTNDNLPLTFQMALAHNPKSMYAFLKMENDKQDEIINQAKNTQTKREMQQLVDKISML